MSDNNKSLYLHKIKHIKDYLSDKIIQNDIACYTLISISAIILHSAFFGINILNPLYDSWLFSGNDITEHYLGWKAFRIAEWNFPIGLTDVLTYPNKVSIIFNDSIPLLAIPFKLLSPILPHTFQYFGLWGLLCFILQGILCYKILHQYCHRFPSFLFSILMILYPTVIYRMYYHSALAGQWILLLALESIFLYDSYSSDKRIKSLSILCGTLSSLVHMYFILMCGIIFIGYLLLDILKTKKIWRGLMCVAYYIESSIIIVFLLGGFSSAGISPAASGLGLYSLNLNTWINPLGFSFFFSNLPLYENRQNEGFGYLGAGVIILLVITLIVLLLNNLIQKKTLIAFSPKIPCLIIILVSLFIGLSPIATVSNHTIYSFTPTKYIGYIWGIFRSTGRMVMLINAIMLIMVGVIICKIPPKIISSIVIAFCLFIQIFDLHNVISEKHQYYNISNFSENRLEDELVWNSIKNNNKIHHLVVTSWLTTDCFYSLGNFAIENRLTLNAFALAHAEINNQLESVDNYLLNPTQDTIFVFDKSSNYENYPQKYKLNYYETKDFIIGYVSELSL